MISLSAVVVPRCGQPHCLGPSSHRWSEKPASRLLYYHLQRRVGLTGLVVSCSHRRPFWRPFGFRMMPRSLEVRIVATVPLVPGDTLSDGLASVFGYRE